jgi:hypothetical protein
MRGRGKEERAMATNRITAPTLLAMLLCATFSFGCAPSHLTRASQSLQQNDYQSAVSYLEMGAQKNDRRCAYLL